MWFLTTLGWWLLCCFFVLIFCALELIKLAKEYKVKTIDELYKNHSEEIIGNSLNETIVIFIIFAPIFLIIYVILYIFSFLHYLFVKTVTLLHYLFVKTVRKCFSYFIEKYGINKEKK